MHELSKSVILIIGTRPDTIKLVFLYLALQKLKIPTLLCSTGQHSELVHDLLDLFHIKPDFDFKIMKEGQDLFDSTQAVLEKSQKLFLKIDPALVVVQGDTTSALSAAMAAFYLKIPVAHVEAGLRTPSIARPFPEELNRRIISLIAAYHFAPTFHAASHLLKEGVDPCSIYCTGNTVVDALYYIQSEMAQKHIAPTPSIAGIIEPLKKMQKTIVLLTAHRRESFDGGLARIFKAVEKALKINPHLHVIYPMHPNPAIRKALRQMKLQRSRRLHIVSPLPYHDLIYVLVSSDFIATDSGGLQEEGVSLNKPVLVLREESDRPEGINEGLAYLVGTKERAITAAINRLARRKKNQDTHSQNQSPYGDGRASQKIAAVIQKIIQKRCK